MNKEGDIIPTNPVLFPPVQTYKIVIAGIDVYKSYTVKAVSPQKAEDWACAQFAQESLRENFVPFVTLIEITEVK